MAEESFQLEQILKRQYHADIRAKTEQNNKLLRTNETLKQQVVGRHTTIETQPLRRAWDPADNAGLKLSI